MNKKSKSTKPRYQDADKKAYYLGVGYVCGMCEALNEVFGTLPKDLHNSFMNGFNAELNPRKSRFVKMFKNKKK